MSTRSLTVINDEDGKEILVMYRQSDGYPSGHGKDLGDLLSGMKIVNGISLSETATKLANGMGCLAAQVVAHFKHGVGGIYLHTAGTRDCGEEYIYTVSSSDEPEIECVSIYAGSKKYKAVASKFAKWAARQE